MPFLSPAELTDLHTLLSDLHRLQNVRLQVLVRGGRARNERGVPAATLVREYLRTLSSSPMRGADVVLMILLADREYALAVDAERWTVDPDAGRWTDAGAQLSTALSAGRPVEGIRRLIPHLVPLLGRRPHSS